MDNLQLPYKLITFKYNEQQHRSYMDDHSHFTLELFYLIRGEATYSFFSENDQKTISNIISPGQFVVFKPHIIHSINTESSLSYFNIEFGLNDPSCNFTEFLNRSEYIKNLKTAKKVLSAWRDVLHFKDHRGILFLLQQYQKIITDVNEEFQNHYLEIFAKRLLLEIIQCSQESLSPSLYNIYIKRALAYLSMNFHRDITPQKTANYLQISETHLERIFKKTLQKTFMQKLNEIRVANATHLLNFSNLPIQAIAESVGYHSLQAFFANFKKIYGCSPQNYRKEHLFEPFNISYVDSNYHFI